ncbi:MAG: peptidylprolyl isomerase [Kofleriaceae bacterium]|nr:peptidylprolyl isomerase [Kofleriaceae bacterium]
MSRFAFAALATCLLAACPGPRAPAPSPAEAARIEIARAEVTRGKAVDVLVERARTGDRTTRMLALRALGRIGSERAMPALLATLHDPDADIVAAAAAAIGVAAQLDEPAPSRELTAELVAALARVPAPQRPVLLEAIGRAGDVSALPVLVASLETSPQAAALALARYGRRKLALSPGARAALIPLLTREPVVRYAAIYALAREHEPPVDPDPAPLVARIADDDPQIRAQAVMAIGKRKLLERARPEVIRALRDPDGRVAIEAVRVLDADDVGRDAIAGALAERYARVTVEPRDAQVVIEAARALAPHALRPAVRDALEALAENAKLRAQGDLAHAWVHCLALSGLERAVAAPSFAFVDACKLPDHLRLPLSLGLVTAKIGDIAARRAAVARLLEHSDPRVQASALGALVALWDDSDDADRRAAVTTLAGAFATRDAFVVGSALEAAPAFYEKLDATQRAPLDQAIVTRARSEADPELAGSLLELIGTRTLPGGREACRAGLAGHPVRAKAARTCLRAFGESVPPVELAALAVPPHDVTGVIGKRFTWHLATTRGAIAIELLPEVAPWAVASIVALTRKGFYDGLEVHRVVGNFVVQGGDPTMTGAGGPGYTLPSEPASVLDGAGFEVGGVGIADAGRDSGGSQWFVMHGRAPHLDGRYTWIGKVTDGQKAADALVIGDKVLEATVRSP